MLAMFLAKVAREFIPYVHCFVVSIAFIEIDILNLTTQPAMMLILRLNTGLMIVGGLPAGRMAPSPPIGFLLTRS
jgi:hypothetical protein